MAEGGKLVCVGMIAGAHGVKGMVKLQSFTDPYDALGSYPILDESGVAVQLQVTVQPGGKLLGRVSGLDDRTQAESLRGKRLYVARHALPEADEGEYYHVDLIGMAAHDGAGKKLGTVAALHNFGASDIVEIKPDDSKSFMLPFTEDFVPEVDVDAQRIVIAHFEEVE